MEIVAQSTPESNAANTAAIEAILSDYDLLSFTLGLGILYALIFAIAIASGYSKHGAVRYFISGVILPAFTLIAGQPVSIIQWKIKMMNRRKNYLAQQSLKVFAIALTYFVLTIHTEQFVVFAQQQSEQTNNGWAGLSGSEIGEIQLHPFTFWDKWKIGTLAYFNPLAPTGKSVIFIYEFPDEESVREALQKIKEHQSSLRKMGWYIGQMAGEAVAGRPATWRPTKLDEFELESASASVKPVVASNLRLPGEKNADVYWVPYDEWAALVEKDR